MCVAKYGHLSVLELLVEFGAEVDAQDKVTQATLCLIIIICTIICIGWVYCSEDSCASWSSCCCSTVAEQGS